MGTKRVSQAEQAAKAFVFHGPRYHGAGEAESDGIEGGYRLKDTASFVRDLLKSMDAGLNGKEVNPYWLAVAGYGSGKSHLALTTATLLSSPQVPLHNKYYSKLIRLMTLLAVRLKAISKS